MTLHINAKNPQDIPSCLARFVIAEPFTNSEYAKPSIVHAELELLRQAMAVSGAAYFAYVCGSSAPVRAPHDMCALLRGFEIGTAAMGLIVDDDDADLRHEFLMALSGIGRGAAPLWSRAYDLLGPYVFKPCSQFCLLSRRMAADACSLWPDTDQTIADFAVQYAEIVAAMCPARTSATHFACRCVDEMVFVPWCLSMEALRRQAELPADMPFDRGWIEARLEKWERPSMALQMRRSREISAVVPGRLGGKARAWWRADVLNVDRLRSIVEQEMPGSLFVRKVAAWEHGLLYLTAPWRQLTAICGSVSKVLLATSPDVGFKEFRLAVDEAIKGCKHDTIHSKWLKDCLQGHEVEEIYVYNVDCIGPRHSTPTAAAQAGEEAAGAAAVPSGSAAAAGSGSGSPQRSEAAPTRAEVADAIERVLREGGPDMSRNGVEKRLREVLQLGESKEAYGELRGSELTAMIKEGREHLFEVGFAPLPVARSADAMWLEAAQFVAAVNDADVAAGEGKTATHSGQNQMLTLAQGIDGKPPERQRVVVCVAREPPVCAVEGTRSMCAIVWGKLGEVRAHGVVEFEVQRIVVAHAYRRERAPALHVAHGLWRAVRAAAVASAAEKNGATHVSFVPEPVHCVVEFAEMWAYFFRAAASEEKERAQCGSQLELRMRIEPGAPPPSSQADAQSGAPRLRSDPATCGCSACCHTPHLSHTLVFRPRHSFRRGAASGRRPSRRRRRRSRRRPCRRLAATSG